MSSQFAPHNMTGNSAPSPFVASASSNYGGYDPYHAFDGVVGSGQYWIGTGGGTDYLQLDTGSGNSYILGDYQIQANTIPEPTRCPKNWTMQGSNDGTTWTTVDTQTNQTSWGSGEARAFTAATHTTAYRYFRLSITANNGDATYTDVGELYLYIYAGGDAVSKANVYAVLYPAPVIPGAGTLTLTGGTESLLTGEVVLSGTLALTGAAPSLGVQTGVPAGTLTLTGSAPTVTRGSGARLRRMIFTTM